MPLFRGSAAPNQTLGGPWPGSFFSSPPVFSIIFPPFLKTERFLLAFWGFLCYVLAFVMWPLQGLLLALRKLQPLGERGKLQARVSAVSVSRPGKKPLPLLLLLSFSSFALSFSPALSCRSPFLPFVLTEEEEEEGGGRRKSNYKHAPCRY